MVWTKERHEAARARCDAATPGPWIVRDDCGGRGVDRGGIDNDGSDRFIVNEGANGNGADLSFIAYAREDMPAMLDEIERIRADHEQRDHWAYNLGQQHGKALAAPDRVVSAIPLDDLARALWGSRDNGETWDDIVHDHKLDPEGSLLSRARDEAEAVRSLIVARLAEDAKRYRPAEPDAGTAWGRLEALVLAGPIELRAAWHDWQIAREAEAAEEQSAIPEPPGPIVFEADGWRESKIPDAFTPDGAALDYLRDRVRAVKDSMSDLATLGAALGDLFKAAGEEAIARRELRAGAAAIDAAVASVGALLVEAQEPALFAGARGALEEQRRAMVPPMSNSTPPDVGTPPDPGIVLRPAPPIFPFMRTITWSQLADAPDGGKVLPALRRGERALFSVPDGTTWGLSRSEDGTLTIFVPSASQ